MTTWHKARDCATSVCVEVAKVNDTYMIRDSKAPTLSPLLFTEDEWVKFREGVKKGDFDF